MSSWKRKRRNHLEKVEKERVMNGEKIPLTCINGQCDNAGAKLYTDIDRCAECHGPLFAYDEVNFVDAPEVDVLPESDDLDAARIRSQKLYEYEQSWQDHGGGKNRPGRSLSLLPPPVQTGSFTCPSDLTGCPIAVKPKVKIPYHLFRKWIWLAEQFDTEWIAYLYGQEVPGEPGTIEITDHYFPKQRATPAHCEAEDNEVLPGTIAAVHSHVGMQVFFSQEDQAHFNWPIELVINRRGEIKANGRSKLECGRFHRGEAEVVIEYQKDDPDFVMRDELKRKLTREKPAHFQAAQPASTSGQQGSLWGGVGFQTDSGGKDTRTPEERRKESEALAAAFTGQPV